MSEAEDRQRERTFFNWMVKRRSLNQELTLDLYNLIEDHKAIIVGDNVLKAIISSLIGTCFSLWRAVFIADVVEEGNDLNHATAFLRNLIANNTVGYNSDKAAKNFSFAYYSSTAWLQLELVLNGHQDIFLGLKLEPGPHAERTDERWDYIHHETKEALDRLRAFVEGKAKK
jgi:hypothetical protein